MVGLKCTEMSLFLTQFKGWICANLLEISQCTHELQHLSISLTHPIHLLLVLQSNLTLTRLITEVLYSSLLLGLSAGACASSSSVVVGRSGRRIYWWCLLLQRNDCHPLSQRNLWCQGHCWPQWTCRHTCAGVGHVQGGH